MVEDRRQQGGGRAVWISGRAVRLSDLTAPIGHETPRSQSARERRALAARRRLDPEAPSDSGRGSARIRSGVAGHCTKIIFDRAGDVVPSVQSDTRHSAKTKRQHITYVFTPKHHGGDRDASCWLTSMPFDEEFAVFDRADGIVVAAPVDHRQVADSNGNLYGYEILTAGRQHLRELGTWHQQMAEFPVQKPGSDWHGYPIWAIDEVAPQKYLGQKCRPEAGVFDRMVQIGDIDDAQRKRLKKGEWI